MKVPEELLKKWQDLKSFGDGRKIVDLNDNITEMDISRAFAKGECSDNVFQAIAKFYKEKEEMVKPFLG